MGKKKERKKAANHQSAAVGYLLTSYIVVWKKISYSRSSQQSNQVPGARSPFRNGHHTPGTTTPATKIVERRGGRGKGPPISIMRTSRYPEDQYILPSKISTFFGMTKFIVFFIPWY